MGIGHKLIESEMHEDEERIIMELKSAVIENHARFMTSKTDEDRSSFNESIDRLLAHLLDQYPEPPSPEEFLAGFEAVTKNREPDVPPRALPVFVMRSLIKENRIIFDVKSVPHWSEFTKRYGSFLFRVE